MSTRARIAIENEDGTYTSIYTHSDGYLSHNGSILLNHYGHLSKVKGLIELGDCSVLGESLISTVSYSRDRGENIEATKAADSTNWLELIQLAKNCWAVYLYVFRNTVDLGWHWCYTMINHNAEGEYHTLHVLSANDL